MSLPRAQKWLIQRLQALIPNVDEKGICYGVAHMGMQAFLSKDLITWKNRLDSINQIPPTELSNRIENIRAKRKEIVKEVKEKLGPTRELTESEKLEIETNADLQKKLAALLNENLTQTDRQKEIWFNAFVQKQIDEEMEKRLSQEEKIVFDILPFFEGVELYHRGYNYSELFEENTKPKFQNALLSFPLAASKSLEGGIARVGSLSGAYTYNELNDLFDRLRQTFKTHTERIAFTLRSYKHCIMVGYDPTNDRWTCINANNLSISNLPLTTVELTSHVAKSFSENLPKDSISIFHTDIYVPQSYKEKVSKEIACIKDPQGFLGHMHRVTKRKATTFFDKHGASWLFIAAKHGDSALVEKLLNKKADPNHLNNKGVTPLYIAVQKGHTETVKILLEKGANINQTNKGGITPLYMAARHGHTEIVKMLLEKGANINQANQEGATPLYVAARAGHTEIVKMLLEKEAKIDQADKNADTPLQIATYWGHIDIVKMLLEKDANVNQVNKRGVSALFLASQEGHKEIASLLLSKGASTHSQFKTDTTSLRKFAEGRNVAIKNQVETFIQNYKSKQNIFLQYLSSEILLKPNEIAMIMGQGEILEMLAHEANKSGENPLDTTLKPQSTNTNFKT